MDKSNNESIIWPSQFDKESDNMLTKQTTNRSNM